jgi:hypothetical protein
MQKFTLGDELVVKFRKCFPTSFLYFFWPYYCYTVFSVLCSPNGFESTWIAQVRKPGFQLQVKSKSEPPRILLRDVFHGCGEPVMWKGVVVWGVRV